MEDLNKLINSLSFNNPVVKVRRSMEVYRNMKNPSIISSYYRNQYSSILDKDYVSGSSPTEIFIGRFGYPKVFIGPMISPFMKDSSMLANPSLWKGLPIEKIIQMRLQLVRGMHISNIHDVENGRVEEEVRDLALSDKPADSDINFIGKPLVRPKLDADLSPFGPTVKIKDMMVSNSRSNRDIERLYSDYDANAGTAVKELYKNKVDVYRIQKGVSAGLFGLKSNRKFVPTRWSITMVDDLISKSLREEVKGNEKIDNIKLFYNVALDNRWLIVFMPSNWEYESIEAFYPRTTWNVNSNEISIYSSYEGYRGRKKYAEIGGCYYAARLEVGEKLKAMKKQASVLILREVHEGYTLPVGVWNVREHVKQTLETKPVELDSYSEMFRYINEKLDINVSEWVKNSKILTDLLKQRRL